MVKKDSKIDTIMNWVIIFLAFLVIVFLIKYITDQKTLVRKYSPTEEYNNLPKMTIIYAYSKTCPFCTQFENTFDVVTKEFIKSNTTYEIDVQKIEKGQLDASQMKHIDGFPTVLVYHGGEFIKKSVGKMPADSFMKFLESSA